MSGKIKFPRAASLGVARRICDVLKLHTEKLIVAGSLRRRKQEVGDVEIVYIPKMASRPDPSDLFGAAESGGKSVQINLCDEIINAWVKDGHFSKRPKSDGTFTWGEEIKLAVHNDSGIPVDFFQARPANWFCLLVCRTGSKESNERICNAAIARGWRWNPYGAGFHDRATGELVRTVRSERDVFEAVGLSYKEPWERV
jgi:DNA polymerase/3'-5' exonuclease PolX